MDEKDAIEFFEKMIDSETPIKVMSEYYDDNIGEAIDVAIEAMRKQIPEKPTSMLMGISFAFKCPNCGVRLDEYIHHCECGKAIDWSEWK